MKENILEKSHIFAEIAKKHLSSCHFSKHMKKEISIAKIVKKTMNNIYLEALCTQTRILETTTPLHYAKANSFAFTIRIDEKF